MQRLLRCTWRTQNAPVDGAVDIFQHVADTAARTQRQVSVDGKTHTITRSVIRFRDVPRRATTPVLAFWADNGKEDTFDFAAEFSVHVEPPKQCEGCSNITQVSKGRDTSN